MTSPVSTLATVLLAASASIVLLLGGLHLLYTFRGPKLYPRDRALLARMREVPLVISPHTTTWDAGVGFHASHSFGAVLFAGLYLYLALESTGFLVRAPFLVWLGGAYLVGMVFVAKRYWFSVPLAGLLVALGLYAAAVVVMKA